MIFFFFLLRARHLPPRLLLSGGAAFILMSAAAFGFVLLPIVEADNAQARIQSRAPFLLPAFSLC